MKIIMIGYCLLIRILILMQRLYLKMLEANKDIVSCPYPMKMFDTDKNVEEDT